ncbi:50S ribosomal protein L18, partial [Dysosmobacter welbionis]
MLPPVTPIWRSTASGSRRCKNKTSLLSIQTTAPVPFGTGAAFWVFRTRPPAAPGTGAPGRGRRGRNGPGCSRTPGDGRSAPLPSSGPGSYPRTPPGGRRPSGWRRSTPPPSGPPCGRTGG